MDNNTTIDTTIHKRIEKRFLIEREINLFSKIKNLIILIFLMLIPIKYLIRQYDQANFILFLITILLIVLGFICLIISLSKGVKKYKKILFNTFLYFLLFATIGSLTISIVLFLMSVINEQYTFKKIYIILSAIVANYIVAFLVHYIPFLFVAKTFLINDRKKITVNEFFVKLDIKIFFIFLLSPDYALARIYKGSLDCDEFEERCNHEFPKDNEGICEQCLENRKYRRKYFITLSNWMNFTFIALLMIVFLFNEVTKFTNNLSFFFLIFIAFHILSRIFEVAYAFYNDVVKVKSKYFNPVLPEKVNSEEGVFEKILTENFINYWRGSAIRRPERISLAIHSYVEIILLFTLFYYFFIVYTHIETGNEICNYNNMPFLFNMCEEVPHLDNKYEFSKYPELYQYLLLSASVTFFNFSFLPGGIPIIWQIAHVIQVFMSIILIVLSLAMYIGWKDEISKDEIREFMLLKARERREPLEQQKNDLLKKIKRKEDELKQLNEELASLEERLKIQKKYIR